MFNYIYIHLYSIIETVLCVFYEAISNKSVYSLQNATCQNWMDIWGSKQKVEVCTLSNLRDE